MWTANVLAVPQPITWSVINEKNKNKKKKLSTGARWCRSIPSETEEFPSFIVVRDSWQANLLVTNSFHWRTSEVLREQHPHIPCNSRTLHINSNFFCVRVWYCGNKVRDSEFFSKPPPEIKIMEQCWDVIEIVCDSGIVNWFKSWFAF